MNRTLALAVCSHATNTEDARMLLDMLGVWPEPTGVYHAGLDLGLSKSPWVKTSRKPTLQDELDELERTDPTVKAAAESYDRMRDKLTGRFT